MLKIRWQCKREKYLAHLHCISQKTFFILDTITSDTIFVQRAFTQSSTLTIIFSVSVLTAGSSIQHPFLRAIGVELQSLSPFQLTYREQLQSYQPVGHQFMNVSQYMQT